MDKDTFWKLISALRKSQQQKEELDNLLNCVGSFKSDSFEELSLEWIERSVTQKDDCSHWIEYFVYELDFGKKYQKGWVKDGAVDIKLATIENCYNLLIGCPDIDND